MEHIVKCQLYFKSFKKDVLCLKSKALVDECKDLYKITNISLISLPTKIKKITVNASPHIDKKAREQFEMRTYSSCIEITCNDYETVNKLLDELRNKSFIGLNIKVVLTYTSNIFI